MEVAEILLREKHIGLELENFVAREHTHDVKVPEERYEDRAKCPAQALVCCDRHANLSWE